MDGDDVLLYQGDSDRGPDDLALAWDATDRYAVMLLWQALPEVRSVQAPADALHAAAEVIRSSMRKRPYKQLARRVWRRGRPPARDTELWLDAAGAMATMDHHLGTDPRTLGALAVLRPADWAGAVIGMVRAGIGVPVTGADLVRYARECPEITKGQEPDDDGQARGSDDQAYRPDGQAYDPFASGQADDQSLHRAFEAALVCWEAVGAVNEQWWLTGLGWWGLPRALARAWNRDFDAAAWAGAGDDELPRGTWQGGEASPDELGIHRPPPIF